MKLKKAGTDYIKLIRLLIRDNKLLFSLSLVALIIGFSFNLIFYSISGAIIKVKQNAAVKTYGKFLLVFSDISAEHAADIKESIPEFDYRQFQISGNLTYENTKVTYGCMDQTLGSYLGFELIYGSWPHNEGQAVIEGFLAAKMGIDADKLPCKAVFRENDTQKTFEITGIISNYSSNLSAYNLDELKTGVYPSVICGGKMSENGNISLIVSQKKLNFKSVDDDIAYFLGKYYQMSENIYNISFNEKLGWHGYVDLEDIINIRYVHSFIIYLFLLIIEIVIIKTILLKNKKTFYIFKSLGLSTKKKNILTVMLVSLFLISALLLSLAVLNIINLTYINRVFSLFKEAYNREIYKYFTAQLISVILFISCFAIIIFSKKDLQIIEGIRKLKIRNSKPKFKKININAVFLYTVLLFCIISSMNFADMFKVDNTISYNLISKDSYAIDKAGTYSIVMYNRYFQFSTLDPLRKYSDYLNISAEGEAFQFSILLEKDKIDSYFNNLIEYKNNDSISVPPEAENYLSVSSDQFIITVLPEKEFNEFLKENNIDLMYPESNKKPDNDTETAKDLSCILIIPNYDPNNDNTSIRENGYVNIGGIRKTDDSISFQIERFKVEHIIAPETTKWMPIQMIISENEAKKIKSIAGYDTISITVSNDTPTDLLEEIDNSIYLIAASVQGGMFDTSLKNAEENRLLGNYTGLLSSTVFIFSIFSIMTYIILSTCIDYENNKHEYGVLRSFGMSYNSLQHKLFIQFTLSIMLSVLVASIFGYLAFQEDMTPVQIHIAVITALIVSYICRIVLYFIYKKQPVSSMVNDN